MPYTVTTALGRKERCPENGRSLVEARRATLGACGDPRPTIAFVNASTDLSAWWDSRLMRRYRLGSTKAARTGGGITASAPLTAFQMISLNSRVVGAVFDLEVEALRDVGHGRASRVPLVDVDAQPGDGYRA